MSNRYSKARSRAQLAPAAVGGYIGVAVPVDDRQGVDRRTRRVLATELITPVYREIVDHSDLTQSPVLSSPSAGVKWWTVLLRLPHGVPDPEGFRRTGGRASHDLHGGTLPSPRPGRDTGVLPTSAHRQIRLPIDHGWLSLSHDRSRHQCEALGRRGVGAGPGVGAWPTWRAGLRSSAAPPSPRPGSRPRSPGPSGIEPSATSPCGRMPGRVLVRIVEDRGVIR
jgi:hypothetical protein